MNAPLQALAVCGPTASGKTSLGISLSRELGGEVVNVDSVQVYKGVDIGSAKASPEEQQGVPHHLLDLVAPNHQMTAGEYRELAIPCMREISSRRRVPILVGGSGMYLTVLLHGIADVPPTPPLIRDEVSRIPRAEQYAELQRVDPVTAERLHPNDTQRISRALEIVRVSGKKPSEYFEQHRFGSHDVAALVLVICRERDDLYERINQRARAMLERGLLDETRQLRTMYGRVPVLETIGYKQACEVIDGTLPVSACADAIALHTRRFAKRQMTYLRNEPIKRGWSVRPTADEDAREIVGFSTDSSYARAHTKGFRAVSLSARELNSQVATRLSSGITQSEVWYVHVD